MTATEERVKRKIERSIQEIGDSVAVERFPNKYGKNTTERACSMSLTVYLRWL